MRLGIIGAMDVEVAILKERMTDLTVAQLLESIPEDRLTYPE